MVTRSRSRTADVTVTVDLCDFDDDDIRAEAEMRGLDVLGVDLDDLRRAIRKGSLEDALFAIERALPTEFAGLADQIAGATLRRAA